MSFWDLSDGTSAAGQGGEYEVAGPNLEPIPDGSTVLAMIDEAKWDAKPNKPERFISLRWTVLKPEAFANRKLFQKLWVDDMDPQAKDGAKKRDKARRMLAAIDANAGGKLTAVQRTPVDDDLALALSNRPMTIRLGQWSIKADDGSDLTGNWVQAVGAKNAELKVGSHP
jgi:hypothetical protein